ncbi:DNA-binding response regulator [Paenibacillus sp. YIM B09110]|uniref:DNA-binding response regulator n=1 Tax=Paenibacillus sp. YIM B09110 TaxID=3126102 RepID=UPI00301BE8D6
MRNINEWDEQNALRNESGLATKEYESWFASHMAKRAATSERKRRLVEGERFSEQVFATSVWWDAVGSFDYLHPEYEINDFRDGSRFIDFAYVRPPYRIAIEIDGYGPHQRNASRRIFGDDRFRQNQLVLDGWHVIRFAYDDVRDKPRQCQQFIQQLLGKLYGLEHGHPNLTAELSAYHRELLRWALLHKRVVPIRPRELGRVLAISGPTVRKLLHQLVELGMLERAAGNQRIRSYKLTSKACKLHL